MNWAAAIPGKLIDAARGRTTFFAGAFFLSGNVLHWFHRLDGTYITFMGTLMAVILGHSVKEDMTKPDDAKPDDPKPTP